MDRSSDVFSLPVREGERPQTGGALPHLQLSQKSPDPVREALKAWAIENLPDVREEDTQISVRSTRAFWLAEHVPVRHDDAFMPPAGGREFAHVHLDGSMHLCVSDAAIAEIVAKAWGEPHPLKDHGVNEVLFYAPRDAGELRFAQRALAEAYRYATGRSVTVD
ncbi:MAG: luciferase family protein [Acidobacteriota bacterium]